MTADVGVIRDEQSLVKALAAIGALERDKRDRRLANMLTTAKLIAAAALRAQGKPRRAFPQRLSDAGRPARQAELPHSG